MSIKPIIIVPKTDIYIGWKTTILIGLLLSPFIFLLFLVSFTYNYPEYTPSPEIIKLQKDIER